MTTATLGEMMTKNVVVARSSESVESVRRLMVQHRISRVVLVNERSNPVGVITDKDLLRQTLTEGSDEGLEEIIAATIMSKPLVTVSEETSVSSCAKRMLESAISSVVVVRGDALAGIVTKTDMCIFYAVNRGASDEVEKRMTRKPVTARASQGIVRAARIMAENNISRLPIVNNQLDGIVTLSDLTAVNPALSPALVSAKGKILSVKGKVVLPTDVHLITIGDIMTRNPITILESAYLSDAAKLMISHRISGLPVLNVRNQLVGIVTKTDVTKAVAATQ
ncbi:MAG: CBS domain-containing protein [Thaumarchaeota archaeon]|nr:CBS domain-containing protein [Nitrososphaerota archaeon]